MLSKRAHVSVDTGTKLLLLVSGSDISYYEVAKKAVFNRYFGRVVVKHARSMTPVAFATLFKKEKPTHIITTSLNLMAALKTDLAGKPSDNWGLRLVISGVPMILVPPLKHIYTVPSGKFLLERFTKKLMLDGADFLKKDAFTWKMLAPEDIDKVETLMNKAALIAVDIETGPAELRIITSVAYTGLINGRTYTYVIPFRHDTIDWALPCMRRLNKTAPPKVMQNGRYDSVYFIRFNAPIRNYLFDTYHMHHCMYPELDKDLASISAFYLDNYVYWKEESKTNLYEYNAKDTHNTLWVFLAQLMHMRLYTPYARANYLQEFPMVFPCILCELEGIAVDEDEMASLRTQATEKQVEAEQELCNLIGIENFNVRSPKQVVALLNALGAREGATFESSDKVNLQNFADMGPFYARLIEKITKIRLHSKAISTYFNPAKLLNGRLHYSLDPAGTETQRFASKASSLWCGHNEQNIPPYAKSMYHADAGYVLCEPDKSQAESWCTGYLSTDAKLLEVLHTSPDFHCSNAELFFGIPFAELYNVETGEKLMPEIRKLAKRTNHGANYNMGAYVLWTTMGTANVIEAGRLLGLPAHWEPMAITEYLLECFDAAYPTIRDKANGYYGRIIREVTRTGKLVGPTGFTRRTFMEPTKSKRALNVLCAHPSQSLSVLLVNQSFWKLFTRQLDENDLWGLLRLKAQNHDSILAQVRDDARWVADEITHEMIVPCKVHGKVMEIPGETGPIGKRWIDIKD